MSNFPIDALGAGAYSPNLLLTLIHLRDYDGSDGDTEDEEIFGSSVHLGYLELARHVRLCGLLVPLGTFK